MADTLKIQLLGGFSVVLNEQPVRSMRTAKTRALLAYLAVEADQTHSRMKLATLLWGELPDAAAKTNLRIELSNLRNVLAAHPALEVTRNDVSLHSALATIDVHQLRAGIRRYLALPAEAQATELSLLAAAINTYQGEFMAGFSLNDAIEFEDWQLITREQLHEEMMLALNTLQLRYAEQGRWADLAAAARRQIAIVPWTESAHRNLMQALAAQGQTQAALTHFERCRQILQEELGVEPSLPTLELAARLRGDTVAPPVVQHNLTQQLKLFVGRKAELAQVRGLVRHEKLVTLLGLGGAGKSHLAQAVAQSVLHDFAHGVWFVPLANISAGESAAERIALAIAAAVGFQVTDMQAPLAELSAYLTDKQMLLVLDNWEHLLDAAATILFALLEGPAIHILATSRVRLMAAGEVPVHVEGLPSAEALTLFVDRGRRVVPTFAVGEEEELTPDILRLCAQVGGLPLGIELAASWVEHYTVTEISESIAQIAIQPEQSTGVVSRHHTLSGVLEYSWHLLNPRQQHILARLSLFHGGFDRTAVAAVVEGTLGDLSSLIAHSLVQRVGAGRYDLHPLIQEFAAGQLSQEEAQPLRTLHSQHFLAAVVETERKAATSQLRSDFENVRIAWQHATLMTDEALIAAAAKPFANFFDRYGLTRDGEQLFADAVERLERSHANPDTLAHLVNQWAHFVRMIRGMAGVVPLAQRVLTLASDPKLIANAHLDIGDHFAETGEWTQADLHFNLAEAAAQKDEDLHTYIAIAEAREFLYALHFRGDFAKAIKRLEEFMQLLDTESAVISERETLRIRVLESLSVIANRYGDYALAIRSSFMAHAGAKEAADRNRTLHSLIDLALSEQFAGLYAAAAEHNYTALAMAEEIGDADEMSLININLCLTLRQRGEPEVALQHGLAGAEAMHKLGNKRLEGQGRNRVGHALSALERWDEAYATYSAAMVVWEPLNHPNRFEAFAGRAVAALHQGKAEEALALVNEVMEFVAGVGLLGIVEPARLLLNCEAVYTALGLHEQAQFALMQAEAWAKMIAERISDDAVRQAFLKRPDNQLVRKRIGSFA